MADWSSGPPQGEVWDHSDPGGDHWGNREYNSGQDLLSFRRDPLGTKVSDLFLNNNTHSKFPRFKNIMSYVENQGVYAVNCASLDEVRTGDVLLFLQTTKSNLNSRQRRRGTRRLGHRRLRFRTWRLEGAEPRLPMDPSPRKMSGCERWGNKQWKDKTLSLKSASRLVPGIGIRGGPGGRYSQVAMVSLPKFIFRRSLLKHGPILYKEFCLSGWISEHAGPKG